MLTDLESWEEALTGYTQHFSIEPMFHDFKSKGYNLEHCQLKGQRFLAVVLLSAMADTLATDQGQRIRRQHVQQYVGRVREPKRHQRRHSDRWSVYAHDRQSAKQAVSDLTQEVQTALENMIAAEVGEQGKG